MLASPLLQPLLLLGLPLGMALSASMVLAVQLVLLDEFDERGGIGGACGIAGLLQSAGPALVVRTLQVEQRSVPPAVA